MNPAPPDEQTPTAEDQASRSDWPAYFEQLQICARDPRLQRFYAAGMVTPVTPIANTPLIAMDFETTGLDAEQNDIVSIGVVPLSMQRIFCRESEHWLLKPSEKLAEESVVIHGITHSAIESAPDLEQILDALLGVLAGRVAVVHYRHIERTFLARAVLNRLGESITFPVIDTLWLEQRIQQQQQRLLDHLLRRPLPSVRLNDCRARYGLPHYQAHHALTDALATAELLQAQITHHFSLATPVGELWC